MPERRILIITNRVPFPLKDGGNMAMNAMVQGYHNAGCQVFLLSMNTTRHFVKPEQLEPLFRNIAGFETVAIDNSIKPMELLKNFLFSSDPEHAVRFYKQDFEEKIIEIIKSFQPDVVQVESVFLATYLPAIREHIDALTVLRLHNVEYQIWQALAKKSGVLKKMYLQKLAERMKGFEREAWLDFDLLLPITEKDARHIMRLEDVNNMVVAPFSIDPDKIVPAGNEQWVGYHIGAMDWLPNAEGITWFLENAWKKIRRLVPSFEFYFAGRNMPDSFKKMSYAGVQCMGEVPDAEAFIADKKILIVPLWSGGGIRVKILEAMAAEKVVIATKAGIKGIDAKPGEHYLQVSSPEDFANTIKWCMDNKDAAEKMAARAQLLVKEKYEHKAVMKRIIAGIEDILGATGLD